MKNAYSSGFNFWDGYWDFSLSASEPLYGTLRLARTSFIFSLKTLGVLNTYPYPKRWPWPLYVASKYMCVRYVGYTPVSYTHLRAHETGRKIVCRLLLEKK